MRSIFPRAWIAMILVATASIAQAPADLRLALVIGNAAYAGDAALRNPSNDAAAMAAALRGLGFEVVHLSDGKREQMLEAVRSAGMALRGKHGIGMLYYAGHALQLDWHNYMVPVDARLATAADVGQGAVDLAAVLASFQEAGNRMNIVVLDACRDNPFGAASSAKGLAQADAPPGTILAFATAPGNVAADGGGEHGLYTQFLLNEIVKPQVRIEDVFKRTRFAVRQASAGRQVPWESTSLEDDFMFNAGTVVAVPKPDEGAKQRALAAEKADWDKVSATREPAQIYAFLAKYPSGNYSDFAQGRLEILQRPAVLAAPGPDGAGTSLVTDMDREGDRYDIVVKDGLTGNVFERATIEMRASGEGFVAQVVSGTSPSLRYSRGGFLLEDRNASYDPPIPRVPGSEFKLGNRTSIRSMMTLANGQRMTLDIEVRIVAREPLDTPFGRIMTYRIETDAIAQNGTRSSYTLWFDPQWGHPLRARFELRTARGGAPEIRVRDVVARSRRS